MNKVFQLDESFLCKLELATVYIYIYNLMKYIYESSIAQNKN